MGKILHNMDNGYIKLYRSFLKWYGSSDPYRTALWVHMLLLANHKPNRWLFKGKPCEVQRGQFITSRKSLSLLSGINESKVERLLKEFKNEQQIEQQSTNINRLITILNYEDYQNNEQQTEQRVNNGCTTDEQRMNTNKNDKNDKNDKNEKKIYKKFVKPTLQEVINYCTSRKNNVNTNKWLSHYESNGWMVGKNKMQDWKAAVRTWESNNFNDGGKQKEKHYL